MARARVYPAATAVVCLALLVAGCLGGPAAKPPLMATVVSDSTVSAQPGWTVGFAVNVYQSVGNNKTAAITIDAPAGWNARVLKPNLVINTSGANLTTFLMADVPANAENNTYSITVNVALDDKTATAHCSVKVERPTANLLSNGSQVQIDYVGFLESNEVFDTSMWRVASVGLDKWPDFKNSSAQRRDVDYKPLSLTLGNKQVIPGWELGLQNMSLGEGKAMIIPPELAYGNFFNQSINRTLVVPIYNTTTVEKVRVATGQEPQVDAEFVDPVFGWTWRIVDINNASGELVLENMPQLNRTYTPYGVNATVRNLSSANGTFEVVFEPVLNEEARSVVDNGVVVDVNATAFIVRWQTEHRNSLAPFTLYFLVYVRTAT